MKKIFLSVLLIMLTLSLIACSSNKATINKTTINETTNSSKNQEESTQTKLIEITSSTGYKVFAPSFLDEEQQTMYVEAYDIAMHFFVSTGYFSEGSDSATMEQVVHQKANGTTETYYKCDESLFPTYQEFYNYITSIYTVSAAENMLEQNEIYINVDGNLFSVGADRGGKINYKDCSYELVSKSEDKIVFNIIAEYYNDQETPDTGTYTQEYPITLVNTKDGWRFENFDLWF